jgi:hydrogenase expression/formation protein HypC
MCRAVPRRVLEMDGERARVEFDDHATWVSAIGLPDLAPGEYVVVLAGQALERIPREEAEEYLDFQAELERMLEEASE